jgi:hypothetical protein
VKSVAQMEIVPNKRLLLAIALASGLLSGCADFFNNDQQTNSIGSRNAALSAADFSSQSIQVSTNTVDPVNSPRSTIASNAEATSIPATAPAAASAPTASPAPIASPSPDAMVTRPITQALPVPKFAVYDTSFFVNKANTLASGLQPMRIIDRGWTSSKGLKELPDEASFKQIMQQLELADAVTPVVINIETWSFACKDASGAPTGTPEKFETIIRWTREAAPKLKIGIYLVAPIRDYWNAIKPEQDPAYIAWQANNDCYQKVVDGLDFLLPSLYTFYEDAHPWAVDGWVSYATANLKEARRLAKGKPIYPFLWMQYHESNSNGYALKLISGTYWRTELELVKKLADGVVIWGTISPNATEQRFEAMTWDENSEWWVETKTFLKTLK